MLKLLKVAPPLLLVVVVLGCGGDPDSGSEASTGDSTVLSKAQLIAAADKICKETDRQQIKDLEAKSKPETNLKEQEALVLKYGIPPIETARSELEELVPPASEEKTFEEFVKGMKGAIEQAKREPESVIIGAGPFVSIEKYAKQLGFNDCRNPS